MKDMVDGFRIKQIYSDFIVNELPNLSFNFYKNDYMYYALFKRGVSTFDSIDLVAKKLGVAAEDISYAGLKDEEGETCQYISVSVGMFHFPSEIEVFSSGEHYVSIRFVGFGSKKITTGDLAGNYFNITIRNCKADVLRLKDQDALNIRFVNYYDTQRFGTPDNPMVTHLLGKALIDGNDLLVEKYLNLGGQELSLSQVMNGKNIRKKAFYMSAYESYRWNEAINNIIVKAYPYSKVEYENGIKYCFTDKQSLVELNSNIDLCSIGYYKTDGVSVVRVETKREVVKQAKVSILSVGEDEFNKNKFKINISFSLGKGTYATMLIRQLMSGLNHL